MTVAQSRWQTVLHCENDRSQLRLRGTGMIWSRHRALTLNEPRYSVLKAAVFICTSAVLACRNLAVVVT